MLKALVLVAGKGTRLMPLTLEWPKCLTEVGGVTILENMLSALNSFQVDSTNLVVGYLQEKIRSAIGTNFFGMPITYTENKLFESTNTSYSLLLGLKEMALTEEDDVLILEGDVFF